MSLGVGVAPLLADLRSWKSLPSRVKGGRILAGAQPQPNVAPLDEEAVP